MTTKGPDPDNIFFCSNCSIDARMRLPIGQVKGSDTIGGFCYICGFGGLYIGKMSRKEFKEKYPDIELAVDEVLNESNT